MEDLDLDINNYNVKDLFNLFKITDTLDEISMKNAKKIVLKVHPDKSKLDPKYFLFFSHAYKKLFGIYQFQNKSNNKSLTDRKSTIEKERELILNTFIKKNNLTEQKDFNAWFNTEFEKQNFQDKMDDGYEEWLKSEENIINEDLENKSLQEKFHSLKQKTIVKYDGVVNSLESNTLGGFLLEDTENFGSGLFSSGLIYNDLKEAYSNTLIPIHEDVLHNTKRFNNVNEYRDFRNSQTFKPLTEKEALEVFTNEEKRQDENSIKIAYRLAQECDENRKKNENIWGKMKQILNE